MGAAASALALLCPECGATLRNTLAEPGAKIRCLNCGARFIPAGSITSDMSAAGVEKSAEAPVKKIREPKAAGYWLLRIPAMIYAAVTPFVFVFFAISAIGLFLSQFFGGNMGGFSWITLMPFVYLPLMPLSAYLFYACATAPARIEAGTIKALWQHELLTDVLPPVPGSSLPFIGPLMVGPSCFVAAVAAGAMLGARENIGQMIPLGPAAIIMLYGFAGALMCEDLRQFFWRQRAMAGLSVKDPDRDSHAPIATLGLYPALAAALIASGYAIITVYTMLEFWSGMRNYRPPVQKGQPIDVSDQYYFNADLEVLNTVILVLAVLAACVTLYLLGARCAAAIRVWRQAARQKGVVLSSGDDLDLMLVRIALIVFALVGSGWITYMTATHSWREMPVFFLGLGLRILGGIFACAALSRMLYAVRDWRYAQEAFWKRRRALGLYSLSTLQRSIFSAGFVLASVETGAFLIMLIASFFMRSFGSRFEPEVIIAMLLGTFTLHFPIFWTLIFTREMLLTQRLAAALKPPIVEQLPTAAVEISAPAPSAESHCPESTRIAAPEIPPSL